MNKLIQQCYDLVQESKLTFFICGGYALELFLNKTIRPHSDIDICLFDGDKTNIIQYMQNKGWNVYEPLNNGLKRFIANDDEQKVEQIFVFCMKPDCSFIKMEPIAGNNYKMHILNPEQLNFDFIEVIFNPLKDGKFVFAQNHNITRELDKTILHNAEGIPYMSPELVLFCKSIYITREGYQQDFDMTVPHLPDESKSWLIRALEEAYPNGHEWLEQLRKA